MSYLSTNTISRPGEEIETLQSRIQGQVIPPEDARYEEARLAWNRSISQHPALIVAAARVEDVVEAVKFARRHRLGIAVQSTGHGVTLAADGGLLVLTSQLKTLRIDPTQQTAWIGAGLKWGEVLEQTQAHGLAPLLGSSPGVGVVGYTLGGGLGWLARKYGLAADSVLAFEVVTADGILRRASPEENQDLYWGLRGGGGSFGVVTGMEIRLYPVETVYGGNLYYPAERAREVMQRYREWIRSAPDALTSSVVLMNFPPFPHIPEPLRGKSFVIVRGCYAGPVAEGEALLEYWRGWQPAAIDDFKAMPFRQVARISNDPVDPGASHSTGAWMRELSDEAIDTLLRYVLPQGGPPSMAFAEVRHIGGAVKRGGQPPAAFSRRDAELLLFALCPTPTPEVYARMCQYTDELEEALGPALTGGVYMNFVHGKEARARTRQGYSGEAYRRLQSVKAAVDPEDAFCFSYAIAPVK